MATITVPSDPTLPVAGAEIKAAPLKDWITNIRTFIEATNIDEANVDTAGTDGIMGKSIAQTVTGLKTFSNISAAAGGLREVAKFEINPASGTPAANDGLRMTFTADDAGGNATAVGYIDLKMTDASTTSEDSEWRLSTISNASSVTPMVVNATAITLTTGTVAIGTNATVGGGLTVTGTGIFGALTVGSAAISEAELEMLDGLTGGTVTASKAVVVDGNKDIASFRNVTLTGELDAATLDISGNADIDGTTNLDAVDIDGAVQIDATVSVGVDDQGYDVKFFGDTASAYLLWDTSADKLLTAGGATIDIVKDKLLIGGTAVTTTAAELNVLDAVSAGTVTASLAVVVDSNKDIASFRNVTLTGELDAATLDISGDADIDGTANLDAVDIDGAVQIDGTVTVGVDGTGKDVTFFGDTSGSKVVWDESADDLIFTNSGIAVGSDATGDIYYRNSSGYLTRLGVGSNGEVLTTNGTIPNWGSAGGAGDFSGPGSATDNAVVRFSGTGGKTGQNSGVTIDDSNNATGFANLTLSGELDAATGDFSGDVDVDGTLEADAITLGGTALGSLYSPIAGSSSIATVGTVGTGTWEGTAVALAYGGTGLVGATDGKIVIADGSGAPVLLDVGSSTAITVLGTVATGTWQGTAVASAYLDSDTAHLSTTQTFTGDKTFTGTLTVGADDTGKDVKFFGASAGAYMEWDESADQLRIVGASADATTSTGKLLLATSLNDINANDVIGKIEFQAPLETGADAISVSASIKAVAQSTFTASSNATDIIFSTGHSETATEKFRITSQGELGIGGTNYGSDGQVLTSGGAGAAPAWENAASSGHTIQEEGSSLTARANLNFVGAGVTATDDSGNNATKVTVTPTGASLPLTRSDGSTSDPIALTSAALGESLVSDTTPQLGGNLDVNGQSIVSDGSNENIPITPHGTGSVVISKADINAGAIDGTAIGAASASTGAFTTLSTSSTSTISGDMTFVDNAKVTLGTGGDADLYYNGTDVVLLPSVVGSGIVRMAKATATDNEVLRLQSNTNASEGNSTRLGFSGQNAINSTETLLASIDMVQVDVSSAHRGELAFNVYDGSLSERMRITRSGALTVGTTAVPGSAEGVGSATFYKDSNNYINMWDNAVATLTLQANGANTPTIGMLNSNSDQFQFAMHQRTNAGSNLLGQSRNGLASILTSADLAGVFAIGTYGAQPFILATNNSTRAHIDSSGNFGIAMVPGGSHKLDVTGSAGLSTGTAWTNTSDARIKKNVVTITGATDKLKRLRPVSYNYTDQYLSVHTEIDGSKTYHSFIADEYENVFPNAVSTQGDLVKVTAATHYEDGDTLPDGKSVGDEKTAEISETLLANLKQYTPHDLQMYIVAAVQELDARIAALEAA